MHLGMCGVLPLRTCSLVMRSLSADGDVMTVDSRRAPFLVRRSTGEDTMRDEEGRLDSGVGGRGDGVPRGEEGREIETFFGRLLFFVGVMARFDVGRSDWSIGGSISMMSSPLCVVSWYRGLWWFRARLCMLEGWLNTLVSSESSFTRGWCVLLATGVRDVCIFERLSSSSENTDRDTERLERGENMSSRATEEVLDMCPLSS